MPVIYNVTIKPTKKKNRFHVTWHNPETNTIDSFDQAVEITQEETARLWQWRRCQLPIGEKLFRFLDGDNSHFQQALDQANRLGEKLQIHLRTCKQTVDWPFELLAKDGIFLLPQGLHLVRTVSTVGKEKIIQPEDRPLKLLFMACSVLDVKPELDFEREEEAIFHITENLPIDMDVEDSGSLEGLRSKLKQEQYDVVHLSGHANIGKNGRPYFVMEDETGYQHNVFSDELWNEALIENPPRLLFLSGCRTGEVPDSSALSDTPENTAEGSFACLLVENNQVPAVLGWGRSVGDKEASHAGKMIFHELSRGKSILEAAQRARFELIKKFTNTEKPAWPLLRLYNNVMPLNAIVKEKQRWLPKPRRMKHVFLKNSQVKVLDEGFVGRRRQLQSSLCALKQDNDKVGVLLLGTGGLGKSCLAGKICERFPDHTLIIIHGRFNAITLENALTDAFINAQDEKGQQILSRRVKIAEMEFGHDTEPYPNEINQTLLRGVAGSPGLFVSGNFLEKSPLAVGDKKTNFMANTLTRLCVDSFKEKNYLLLLDDFELNMEGADKGQPGPLLPEAADLLNVLLRHLHFSGKITQLIITSRYDFSLAEQDKDMVAQRLEKVWLTSFREAGQRKKVRELKNILNYENQSKVPDLLAAGHGNPRLMEWLDVLVGRMNSEEVSKLLTAIKAKQEVFIRKHMIRELLQRGGKKLERFLSWFSIYRRPVLKEGIRQVTRKAGLKGWKKLLREGMSLSLVEHDQVRQNYQVTPLLRKELLGGLEEHHVCHEAAFVYYKKLCEVRDSIDPILTEEWIFHALGYGEEDAASELGGRLVSHLRERLAYHEAIRVGQWVLVEKKQELSTKYDAFTLNNLAVTMHTLGNHRQAIDYCEQALTIWKKVYGEKHQGVAIELNNLGSVWAALGNHIQSIDYYEQALSILKELFGEKHQYVATALNNLGLVWAALGNHSKAIDYYEQVLCILKELFGEKHQNVSSAFGNLGESWRALGKLRKAIDYYQQALFIDRAIFSDEHPNVAKIFNNLGIAWYDLGNHYKAIEYFERALAIDRKVFGEEHPDVAEKFNNLGSVWTALGNYRKAIHYCEQALAIWEKVHGKKHKNVAIVLNNLGRIWSVSGEPEKAIGYYESALTIDRAVFGEEHPNVGIRLNNLGLAWHDLCEYKKANDYYQKALAIFRSVYGKEHPIMANTLNNLGSVYNALEVYNKAIDYYQQALVIDRTVYGEKHPNVANQLNNIGSVYFRLGQRKKAKGYFETAYAIWKTFLGEEHPNTKIAKKWLEDCK